MRIIFNAIIIGAAANVVLEIMPWWTILFIAFIVLIIFRLPPKSSFFSAALGGGLYFLISSLYTDIINGSLLSNKISILFNLPSPYIIIVITSLIGFISAGLGGILANKFIALFLSKHNQS